MKLSGASFVLSAVAIVLASCSPGVDTFRVLQVTGDVSFDFGLVEPGQELSHDLFVRNTSTDVSVVLLQATSSCGCTGYDVSKERLAPGEEARVTVKMTAKGTLGVMTAKLYLLWMVGNGTRVPLVLSVRCEVGVGLVVSVDPPRLDFGPYDPDVDNVRLFSVTVSKVDGVEILDNIGLQWSVLGQNSVPANVKLVPGDRSQIYLEDPISRYGVKQEYTLEVLPGATTSWGETIRFSSELPGEVAAGANLIISGSPTVSPGIPDTVFLGAFVSGSLVRRTVAIPPIDRRGIRVGSSSSSGITARFDGASLHLSVTSPTSQALYQEWIELVRENDERIRISLVGTVR